MNAGGDQRWGLLACGCVGRISVDVYECCTEHGLFELEIDAPAWSIRIRIDSPDVARKMHHFISTVGESALHIGWLEDSEVTLRSDNEFADRFFIVAGGFELQIAGSEAHDLIGALNQVVEELRD